MERNNVCKFNPYRSSDLICFNFIKECNNAQNNRRSACGTHRSKQKSTALAVLFFLRCVDKKDATML